LRKADAVMDDVVIRSLRCALEKTEDDEKGKKQIVNESAEGGYPLYEYEVVHFRKIEQK
jgi:hypothetical protein